MNAQTLNPLLDQLTQGFEAWIYSLRTQLNDASYAGRPFTLREYDAQLLLHLLKLKSDQMNEDLNQVVEFIKWFNDPTHCVVEPDPTKPF